MLKIRQTFFTTFIRMKRQLLLLLFFFAFTSTAGQKTAKEDHAEQLLDSMMMRMKKMEVVAYVDNYLLTHEMPPQKQANILSFKIAALTELNLFSEALRISDPILRAQDVKPETLARIYLKKAEGYEVLEDFKQAAQNLDLAREQIDANPGLKRQFYTNWLVRKASLIRMTDPEQNYEPLIDEAIVYGTKVNDTYNVALANLLKGFSIFHKDLPGTLKCFSYLYRHAKKTNSAEMTANMQLNIANAYEVYNHRDLARKYVDSAVWNAKKGSDLSIRSWAFEEKAKYAQRENMLDSALYYYKAHKEAEEAYNFAQKQISVKEIDAHLAIVQETLKNEKREKVWLRIIFAVFGVDISLLVFARFLYSSREKIKRQNEQIAEDAAQLSKLVDEKSFLVKELNHRVKNNLAIILSLIDLQSDEITDPNARMKFNQLHNRVETIAMAHKLYSYGSNEEENIRIDLEQYFTAILESHSISSPRPFSFHLESVQAELSMDSVIPLGMVINELITNTLKHAEPTAEEPLEINLTVSDSSTGKTIIYHDNGTRYFSRKSEGSFGTFVIEAMISQIGATFQRNNSTYTIYLPHA